MPQIIGLHNIAFKFRILSGKDFRLKKTVRMQGWTKYHCFFDGSYVEKTPKYLIIVPIRRDERMYGMAPFKLREDARDRAAGIAQYFVDRYDLKLGRPEISRRPHFAVQNALTGFFKGMELSTDEYKHDDSEGVGGEIDFFTPGGATDFMKMPERMDRIERNLEKMTEGMAVYAKHLNAHIPVLVEMRPMMKATSGLLKKLDRRVSQTGLGRFKGMEEHVMEDKEKEDERIEDKMLRDAQKEKVQLDLYGKRVHV